MGIKIIFFFLKYKYAILINALNALVRAREYKMLVSFCHGREFNPWLGQKHFMHSFVLHICIVYYTAHDTTPNRNGSGNLDYKDNL